MQPAEGPQGGNRARSSDQSRGDAVRGRAGQVEDDPIPARRAAASPDSGPSPDQKAATEFFTTATRNLQEAGERAGVRRMIVVSIIGIDRFTAGYMAAKAPTPGRRRRRPGRRSWRSPVRGRRISSTRRNGSPPGAATPCGRGRAIRPTRIVPSMSGRPAARAACHSCRPDIRAVARLHVLNHRPDRMPWAVIRSGRKNNRPLCRSQHAVPREGSFSPRGFFSRPGAKPATLAHPLLAAALRTSSAPTVGTTSGVCRRWA